MGFTSADIQKAATRHMLRRFVKAPKRQIVITRDSKPEVPQQPVKQVGQVMIGDETK